MTIKVVPTEARMSVLLRKGCALSRPGYVSLAKPSPDGKSCDACALGAILVGLVGPDEAIRLNESFEPVVPGDPNSGRDSAAYLLLKRTFPALYEEDLKGLVVPEAFRSDTWPARTFLLLLEVIYVWSDIAYNAAWASAQANGTFRIEDFRLSIADALEAIGL